MQYLTAILRISMMLAATLPIVAVKAEQMRPVPRDLIRAVVAERDANEQARIACASGVEDLRQRILTNTADAEAEAHAAVRRHCFSLITTFNSIPAGIPYALGIECRPNARLFTYHRLMLMSYSGSDVVSRLTPEEIESIRNASANLRAFALAYNRAIVSHPEFPYRDLCRVANDDYRPPLSERVDLIDWGFLELAETDDPSDIWESARRGTTASLNRMIESGPLAIHIVDLLSLTPLAWAVIYDRPEHVRLLLEAGANPYGEPYRDRPIDTSPIAIAEAAGRTELVEMMQSYLEDAGAVEEDRS